MAFNPTVIEKGLNASFARDMVNFLAARSLSPGIFSAAMTVPSTGAYEKMGFIGAMPTVKQWLGELNAKEFASYDYTIKNLDWAAAVPIHENDIDDDQTGSISSASRMLVQRILKHPEGQLINLLINGDVNVAYDGVAFFSDVSGVRLIDNLLGGTGVTLALLKADLISALVAMAKFKDDQGEYLNLRGNMIVCPVSLMTDFEVLTGSASDPTVAAGIGAMNPFLNKFTVIGDPRLDADDVNDWYLLATNEPIKPLAVQSRQGAKPNFERKPLTKTWVYSADYRGNVGYGLPHLAVKVVGT